MNRSNKDCTDGWARSEAWTGSPEDADLLLFGWDHLHVWVRELDASCIAELLEDALHQPGPISALREHRAEVDERQVHGGVLESPAHPRLLGHVVRQVGELVLRSQLAAVLAHHRADDLFSGLEDQLLCELVFALVRDAHVELVPDARSVLRVIEHVPLQDLAV